MTPEEALIWCDDFRDNIVKAGKAEEKYFLALRAMRTAMTALARQIPQKVENMCCPNCERLFLLRHGQIRGADYCNKCGQALDWRD